jgi:PIN domain nuclease of toxin-antitoxin system
MLQAVADTHALIWYLYDDSRLSAAARSCIEEAATSGDQVGFSTVTLAEILYLQEKGRMHPDALERLLTALDEPGSVLVELPFDRAVAAAMASIERDRVPDLPDRIIAATAQLYGVPVISRDRQITVSGLSVIW